MRREITAIGQSMLSGLKARAEMAYGTVSSELRWRIKGEKIKGEKKIQALAGVCITETI